MIFSVISGFVLTCIYSVAFTNVIWILLWSITIIFLWVLYTRCLSNTELEIYTNHAQTFFIFISLVYCTKYDAQEPQQFCTSFASIDYLFVSSCNEMRPYLWGSSTHHVMNWIYQILKSQNPTIADRKLHLKQIYLSFFFFLSRIYGTPCKWYTFNSDFF